jgi:hypothetical protein
MTPLETLQALKIQYDVASSSFEETLELISGTNSRDRNRLKKLEKNAEIFGEIRDDLMQRILKVKIIEEPTQAPRIEISMSGLEQDQRDQFQSVI